MEVNSHILKLTGKAELEHGMTLGDDYTITLNGQIVKQEDKDNQDGTVDRIYTFKVIDLLEANH